MTGDDLDATMADDELGRRLRAAAPTTGDVDATLATLRPRFERARRRRRAAMTGAGALGLAAIVAIGVAALGPGGGSDVHTPPASRPEVSTTVAPTVPTTTATVPLPGATGPGATTATSDDRGGGRAPGDSGDDSGSGTSGHGSGSSGSDSGSSGSGGGDD